MKDKIKKEIDIVSNRTFEVDEGFSIFAQPKWMSLYNYRKGLYYGLNAVEEESIEKAKEILIREYDMISEDILELLDNDGKLISTKLANHYRELADYRNGIKFSLDLIEKVEVE